MFFQPRLPSFYSAKPILKAGTLNQVCRGSPFSDTGDRVEIHDSL
jgi:hypothetical protein